MDDPVDVVEAGYLLEHQWYMQQGRPSMELGRDLSLDEPGEVRRHHEEQDLENPASVYCI